MITLGSIFTKNLNGNFHIEVPVTMNGETRPCWYELPNEYQNMVAEDRCDAFIAAMLLPALYSGEDITCEAPVSARFLYNLNNELIPTLNAFSRAFTKYPSSQTILQNKHSMAMV